MIPAALLSLLLAAGGASAAETSAWNPQLDAPTGNPRLAWEDCVALALGRNPDLAAARFAKEERRAGYLGSFNALLPSLSVSNSVSDSESATPSTNRWSAQATARLDLLDLGSYASIRSSKAGYSRAAAQLRQASTDLRFSLRRAFVQLLFAQENVEVSRAVHRIRSNGAQSVTLRYDSGRESKGNMLRARAQLLQADADLAQAERELRTARRTLDRHLGLDEFRAVTATGTLAAPPAPAFPESPEALVEARPDVEAQRAVIGSAEAGLSSAKSSLWPTVSASYSRTTSGRTEFPSGRYGWTALGTLSLPLFGGGPTAVYYDVAASRSGLERARQDLRSVKTAALAELEGAWSDFARSSAQAGVQAALLEAARQRSEEADIRYASGLLSFDNWEIITSDRVGQERQALQARLNAMASEAAWDRAVGRGLGE